MFSPYNTVANKNVDAFVNKAQPLVAYCQRPSQTRPKRFHKCIIRCSQASTDSKRQDSGLGVQVGKLFGAVSLVTGATVGAGILALPAVSCEPGFIPSASVLVGCWAILSLEALLIAEVNMKLRERRLKQGEDYGIVSLSDMAGETLGETGKHITTSIYFFLVNTLLVAYTSKAGELASQVLPASLPSWAGNLTFVGLFGTLLAVADKNQVQLLVRTMTLGLISSFLVVVVSGGFHADFSLLDDTQNWDIASKTFPIMFLSLVYHDLIPLVCRFLSYDKTSVRLSLLLGSLVPLSMFLMWDAVALSLGSIGEVGADPLAVLTQMQGGWFGTAIQCFSLMAISTSWIGSTLGMSSFLKSELEKNKSEIEQVISEVPEKAAKCLPVFATVLPPLYISIAYPDVFLHATEIAGGYLMTLMYGILPPIMAWQYRNQEQEQTVAYSWRKNIRQQKWALVPGGKPVLAGLTMGSVGLEISKAISDGGIWFNQFFNLFGGRGQVFNVVSEIANLPPDSVAAVGQVGDQVSQLM